MRVIIVHTLEQARAAIEAAEELGQTVTLQSPPGAIFYAGSLYFKELFAQAGAQGILDCGEAGAEAIAALRMGHGLLRSSAAPEIREKLASIAALCGARIIDGPYEALDLREVTDTKDACKKWIKDMP